MRQLDFDRAFAETPECIHESILTAFEKGEKAMKFRHKLTSALTAAAALLIVFGVTALGLNGLEQPVDDAVAPLSSTTQTQDSSNVVSIGGHDLPEDTEIYVNVDPNTFVPWFYSTDEVIFTDPNGAYLHMDFNCAQMEAGNILDVPLLGAINEAGLQLCPECFTLSGIPVRHDGETACLPYHNDSGQESTLAEAVSGGLKLCGKCFLEVYTAEGNPYMHCKEECTDEQIKKFIHSASAASLDACPVCMPVKVDPVTGREARVISSIPMPTPSPEDFLSQNPDWPVQPIFASPTPAPVATPTPEPESTDEALYIPATSTPTPPPVATSVINTETGKLIGHFTLPVDGPEIINTIAESTPAPETAAVQPTPEPVEDVPVFHEIEAFYSSEEDAYVHISADCSAVFGETAQVSLTESMHRTDPAKRFCPVCCDIMLAYIAPNSTTLHACVSCPSYHDDDVLKWVYSQQMPYPCDICCMDAYMDNAFFHINPVCSHLNGGQSCTLGYAVSAGGSPCTNCVYTSLYNEIGLLNHTWTSAQLTPEQAAEVYTVQIAYFEQRAQDNNFLFWIDSADPYYIHCFEWCEIMQKPQEISCRTAILSGYKECNLCSHRRQCILQIFGYEY